MLATAIDTIVHAVCGFKKIARIKSTDIRVSFCQVKGD